jgi:WD40 repeat protein
MRLLQSQYRQRMTGIGFAANGRLLVAGGVGGYETWDLAANTSSHFAVGDTNHVFAFVVDPLGRWLYYSAFVLGCRLQALDRAGFQRLPGEDHHAIALATSRDGGRVAVSRGVSWNNRLECWSIDSETRFNLAWAERLEKEGVSFHGITFHPDGTRLASIEDQDPTEMSSGDYTVVVRDAASGARIAAFGSLPHPLYTQMIMTPRGDLIIWDQAELSLWSAARGRLIHQVKHPRRTNIQGLALHPSGEFFVTVANDGDARFWDIEWFRVTRSLNWKIGKLLSVALSPDGMLAAAGGENGQVVLWDVDL